MCQSFFSTMPALGADNIALKVGSSSRKIVLWRLMRALNRGAVLTKHLSGAFSDGKHQEYPGPQEAKIITYRAIKSSWCAGMLVTQRFLLQF